MVGRVTLTMYSVVTVKRGEKFVKSGKVVPSQPLGTLLSATAIQEICDTTSGLPDEYVTTLMRLTEAIGR